MIGTAVSGSSVGSSHVNVQRLRKLSGTDEHTTVVPGGTIGSGQSFTVKHQIAYMQYPVTTISCILADVL